MTTTMVTAFHLEPWSFVPNNPRLPALPYQITNAGRAAVTDFM